MTLKEMDADQGCTRWSQVAEPFIFPWILTLGTITFEFDYTVWLSTIFVSVIFRTGAT